MRLINPLNISRILSTILLIEAGSFLICLPVAYIYREPLYPFLLSSAVTGLVSIFLRLISRNADPRQISNRDTFLIVSIAWVLFSLAGSMPYIVSGTIPSAISAFFESTSGFTTTGASILTDVESLPYSILFWRSLTHWIGGIGIIVLVILILPSLKVTGYHLFSLESSLKEKIHPRAKGIVYRILIIYLGLTLFQVIFLLIGKMNLFDSLCHSFGTVSTGGFSTRNSSLGGFSPFIQYVTGVFMILGATSYVVFYHTLTRNFTRVRRNEEFRIYLIALAVAVVFVSAILFLKTDRGLELSFRDAFFQVSSQITCTGFATTDYMAFPSVALFFIFLVMFSGGSTGSTSGGIKIARHIIAMKNLRNTFIKIQHPNAVIPIKLNGNIVPEGVVNQMTAFIFLYLLMFIAGSLAMQLSGIPVIESLGASASSLANIGPGLGASGNMSNFAHFNGFAKAVMMLLMILGRLELFTFITIFTRSFRRN
ncbi:MAG: TrkH family potassium uptake protein [Bacteroidales bacterium]